MLKRCALSAAAFAMCCIFAWPNISAPAPKSADVPILIYHSIREYIPEDSPASREYILTPETFEDELRFLKKKGYVTVGFDALADNLEKGAPLPEHPLIISFDDGWESQYKNAFPLLKKFGFTATFFVFTNGIGIKHFMSWDELREMEAAGMTIGSHSRSHPFLTKIRNPQGLEDEIAGSKKILEKGLGHPITQFAYPFGLCSNQIMQMVRHAGYRVARGTSFGARHTLSDLLVLSGLIDITNVTKIESALVAAAEHWHRMPQSKPGRIDPSE